MANELAVYSDVNDLRKYLEGGKGVLRAALPKHLSPERMLRLALTCFSTNDALRRCTGQSILASLVVASQLGLEPGVAGQCYLIPYGKNCTLVPGWRGLVGLLNNSGRATAWSNAVYDGDEWEFRLGSNPKCEHVPGPKHGMGDLTWAYACGQVNGSQTPVIEAWRAERIWAHRDRNNKVGNRHYSFAHPEMYARKVVLLQVLKYMPQSIELSNALAATYAAEEGRTPRVEDGMIIDVVNQPEEAQEATVGRASALEDATAKKSPPAENKGPVASVQTNPKPPAEPEAPQDSEATGGPSLAENQTWIKNKLAALNLGTARFVAALEEQEIIPRKIPFTDLSNSTLQGVIDDWDNLKDKLLPQ